VDNWSHWAWSFAACAIGLWCIVILASLFGHAAGQSGNVTTSQSGGRANRHGGSASGQNPDGVANHKKP
jgi:hypothetical protein